MSEPEPDTMADRLAELDAAIAADPTAVKLLGKRCTLHIERGGYVAALSDAREIVKLCPDAPAGFLKAARCFRLLAKWKAAQKMLDHAAARTDDENTLKAIRTETKKLAKAIKEPVPSFVERLPPELFIEALSFLPQRDIFSASQVSKRWRRVLYEGGSAVWHTLELVLQGDSEAEYQKLVRRAQFFAQRLAAASLESLAIGAAPREEGTAEQGLWTKLAPGLMQLLVQRNMVARLRSLRVLGWPPQVHLSYLLESCYRELRELGVYVFGRRIREVQPTTHMFLPDLLANLPKLQALVLTSSLAHNVNNAVLYPPIYSQTVRRDLRDRKSLFDYFQVKRCPTDMHYPTGLRLLHVEASAGNAEPFFGNAGQQLHCLSGLQYLAVLQPGQTVIRCSLPELKCLRLIDARIITGPGAPEKIQLSKLQSLEVRHHMSRPEPPLRQLLTAVQSEESLNEFCLVGSPAAVEEAEPLFTSFVHRHPNIARLLLVLSLPPDLVPALQHLGNLKELSAPEVQLPAGFFEGAEEHLQQLESLSIPISPQLPSGPLVRFVASRQGQLTTLNIAGCVSLSAEAVDWLKTSVPTLKWTGWQDPHEGRQAFRFNLTF